MPAMRLSKKVNLLDLKPVRNRRSETDPDGTVTIIVPKFTNPVMVRWFVPLLSRPELRVKLDEHGSFIWTMCDGNTSVGEMAERMKQKYGQGFDPDYRRLGAYVRQLLRTDFIITQSIT